MLSQDALISGGINITVDSTGMELLIVGGLGLMQCYVRTRACSAPSIIFGRSKAIALAILVRLSIKSFKEHM